MANNQQSRTALTGAGARSVPASADRGGYYQLKTKEEQLAYIEKQLQAGESARQNRQTRRQADDSGYYDLETKEEQIAYIENQLKTGAQRRQVRQEANDRKASGKVHQGAAANEPVTAAQKGGKTPYDMTAPAAAAKANANYWEETVRQAVRQPDKDSAFQAFNTYMEANPAAKELWELEERGAGKANALGVAAGARSLADASGLSDQQEARRQELRRDMTEQERATYETMRDLYDSYGELWSLGKRSGEDAAGLLQTVGGSLVSLWDTAVQSAKDQIGRSVSIEGRALQQAQDKLNDLVMSYRAYTYDENGVAHPTQEYLDAKAEVDAAEAALNEKHPETVLTPENSTGVRLYQEGGEKIANAQMGLSDGAKFTMNTANAIAGNAPAMATALIPVVGLGLSLGLTGAQAAGGRAAELSAQGEKAGTALARGLVSGGIEAATEILPVGSWVDIIKNPGGKSALRSILQQMGSEATEESVSYVANYLADLAAQDSNAQFSLEELAENALMGGISGGVYGGVGVGANRLLNRSANDIPSAKSQQQADMVDAEQGDGLRNPAQGAEPAQEAGNAQAPSVTYEQGMANELDRLFGLQSNANQEPAKAIRQQEGNATVQNDAGVSTAEQSATEWNRKAAARMAEQAGLPEKATLRMAQDYNGTANPAVYAKAWADMYNAGRTGSLTEEQVLRAAGSAAAVTNQAEAMHNAYLLGAEEAGRVMVSPAGNAERGATVEYEGGNAIGTLPDELLQAVAARYGVDVDVVNQLAGPDGSAANGKWAAAMARITLGENSGNSYQTLQHELTHYIDSVNPEGWARLKNRILEYAARNGMENVSDLSRQYENSYEGAAVAADEMARDILAGVMSSEENVQAFCEHVASDAATNVQEKRSILQALRDMLDRVIESLRRMMRSGDATGGSEYGRRLAEVQDSRDLVQMYLEELDAAGEQMLRGREMSQNGQKNAPAASAGGEAYSIDPDFDRDIVAWDRAGRKEPRIFRLGSTSEALKSIGIQERSIVMVSDKVRTILREHPGMTLDMIRQIPAMLEEPALILESAGQSMRRGTMQNSRVVVIGNVTDENGAPVLCVLDLAPQSAQDRKLGLQDFNKVSSAYAKDVNPAGFLQKSKVLYASPDKKKTQDALSSFGFQLATSELNHLGSVGSIAYADGSVKMQGEPFEKVFGEGRKEAGVKPAAGAKKRGGQTDYSRPVMIDDQLQAESRKLREEARRLKEERNAWEDSKAVVQIKTRRNMAREQMGLFGIREWDSSTPEWQEYLAKRKQYNERARALQDRLDAIDEQLKSSAETRAQQRDREETARYDAGLEKSGLSRENYRRQKAVELFGVTTRFDEAGYLLPDGTMLDFKGEGGSVGTRGMDHRQIADVFAPRELGGNRTAHMNRFIADGNVRIMAEEPGVDISAEKMPSEAQLQKIKKMADELGAARHRFGLDFSTADGKQAATRFYEGRVRGERVMQDIRAFYRDGALPEQSGLDAFRYSRDGVTDARRDFARENRELARRNMQLEEQLQTLKEEFRLSEGHRVEPKRVRQLARQLVREYESRYDAAQLEGELTRYFEYIANDPDANYADAMDTAQQLMRGVLEQSSRANTELRDAYKPVRDDLRAMSIEVQRNSPAYYELLNEYGDGPGGMRWGNVRRNTFGRVNLKLVDGPGNWDTQFAELAQSHPAVFDADAGIAENVAQALRVFEASEVSYDNPYGLDLDTAAENAAQELFETYMDMPERHTYADRQQQKTMELKAEYRRRREAALERQKAGYEKRLETVRQSNEKRLQGLRSQNAEKLAKQQAMFDQRMANRNEGLRWRQARDQAEKNMKRLYRWVSQPTNTQNVPENMRQAVLQLLDAFDWNTRKPGSKANADMRTALLDIQRMISDPDPSGDSLEYADFDPDLRQEIDDFIAGAEKNAEGRVQIGDAKKFSAMQMQQLNGILTSVTHSITNANKLLAQERNAQLSDVAGKSVEEIHARSDERARERHPWMRKLLDTNIGETAESLTGLDMMDAGSYFRSLGPAAEKIYRAVRKGFDTRTFKIREGQEFMQTLLRGINLADWSGGKAEKSGFTTEGGQKLELTPGQVMELYCLTQRQQAHLHLVQGGIQLELRPGKLGERVHLTATDISNIVASLTPEQVRVAKEMQKYLSTTVAGWGNETSMALYGIRKFREKNYWPIKTSDNFNRTTDANTGDPGLWGIKNAGMTKATKIKANNPLVLRDAFDTWYNHVAQMASYNGWAVPLSDMMKWYNWHDQNNVSVKEAIESLYGSKGKNYFTTLMKDLNGMSDRPSRTGLDKALGSLTRPWKVAKVGANLRVVIQQPTSYLRAAAVIDPKYLTRALSQAPAHLKEGIRNAEKYSAISQWARWGYFETNLGQSMRSVMIGDQTAAERLQELATAPAGAMDRMTRGTLWLACEDEVRATRPELQGEALMRTVADRLDEVIDRTQVVDTVLSRSHLMRSKNALTQMAMNFMAEPTKTWNMMREAAVEMARTKPNSKERSAATKRMARVTATWLVTALGTAAAASIIDSWRVKDDDKDKEWLERYAQALRDNFIDNVNLLGSLPLVKDIMSIAEGYDIERTDMAAFADMMDSMSLLAKTLQGKGNATPYDLIRALSEPVSALTGIPVSNAQRELKSMYDMLTNLQDPLRLDRSLFADPEAVSYTDMVGQIRAEGGSLSQLKRLYGTNGSGNATYTEMLGGEQAEKVDAWLEKLSADTGTDDQPNTSVLPKRVSNKISWTQDGQEMVEYLSGPEYLEYAQTVQSTASRLIADYMDKAGKEADAKQRAEFVEQVKTYAVETAREKSLTDYQPEDWVADIDASGGNVVDQIVARQIISGAESDRDVDGNAVSGSKAKNAVQELVDQGYSVAEARAMYERQENKGESQYLELYEDVSSNSRQADELAALFGADGTEATYAGMLGKGNAKKVDSYLQDLARTAGDDVLPDYLAPLFTYTRDGESQKVELNGREYVEYAGQRTETAYDLLELFLPDARSLPTDTQADVVRSVESYATQTAKAEVSDFEPDSWVRKVQAQAGNDPDQVYALLLARQLIWSAEGQKDANGKTISGSKKAAALQSLQDAGYNQAYAQELYKLFG